MPVQTLGQLGETLAKNYLETYKLQIISTNYHSPYGEIDIIAKEGECFVFVEVKARSNVKRGTPLEAVTPRKRERILLTAQHWLSTHLMGKEEPHLRFDVLSIVMGSDGLSTITHHKSIFGEDTL